MLTATAALILIALVPGYLFLRLTERVRQPRSDSSLVEMVGLVSVGAATTGAVTIALAGGWPSRFANAVNSISARPVHVGDIRPMAIGVALVVAGSSLLAVVAAWVYRLSRPSRFVPSVWFDQLGERPGVYAFVAVTLKDNVKYAGTLLGSDAFKEPGTRDIVVGRPHRYAGGKWEQSTVDVVVLNERDVVSIELVREPVPLDGGTVETVRGGSLVPTDPQVVGLLFLGAAAGVVAAAISGHSRHWGVAVAALVVWKAIGEIVDAVPLHPDRLLEGWRALEARANLLVVSGTFAYVCATAFTRWSVTASVVVGTVVALTLLSAAFGQWIHRHR